MRKMEKKYIKFFLKAAVSLVFIALIIFKTNWPEFLFYIKKISFWSVGIYIIILIISMLISSYKWQLLAAHKGFKLSVMEFFKLYLTGTFINNFMPSFVAGDAFKAYEIAKKEGKYSEAASTVVMDRVTGLVGAMLLALLASLLNLGTVLGNKTLLIINILIILSLVADVALAFLRKSKTLKSWVFRIAPQKLIDFLREFYAYGRSPKVLKTSILYGIIFSFVGVAILNYILFISLGIDVGFRDYFSVIFLISIVSALPITVNNIGLKEWAYITFFGFFGVNSGAAVAVAVISRFLQMAISFFALPIYIKAKK